MAKAKGKLYLIPNLIGDSEVNDVLPSSLKEKVMTINHYIVEDIRTTRRFLRKVNKQINIDGLTFYVLNKHTSDKELSDYLEACTEGHDIGLISEAGLPCVADPGNVIVKMAHAKNLQVVPLAGPSSLFMALMASGMNGQNFAFNGYLPIERHKRIAKLKQLENRVKTEDQSQLFMETPYRNNKMLDDILANLNPKTYLCIAVNVTNKDEFIKTMRIESWNKTKPDLNKKPCIFII